ncbi:glycosyltransferase [Pleurocapsa sp. PCC 7319]|uniref:glycosyltransferase n=1 Tax=Pleurocapsa sp. PCC 7319 TaxID=118161 RepID=UPI00037C5450|nr:glycosyltransferase [Pleurocapsa sp. PCC 7319]
MFTKQFSRDNSLHRFGTKPNVSVGQKQLMLFDLVVGGHHGSYIQHLVEYWVNQNLSSKLHIVVSPRFLERHADVAELISEHSLENINLVVITSEEEAALNSNGSKIKRSLRAIREWNLLCKYAKSLEATHCLIMYFDTCWLPLVLGKKAPCDFSGIYFRPTLHYRNFADYSASGNEKLPRWREKLTLTRILGHSQLQTLFCIDPFAPKFIEDQFQSSVQVLPLADPVKMDCDSKLPLKDLKDKLGIEANRKVFLLFGALTGRKGVNQLLESISFLPPELCRQICFLIVGEGNQQLIEAQAASICQTKPLQVISHCQFVPEEDVPKYFQLSDFVLAPYQRHIGMSGILLLAAAAQKPILSSNYGLMGELVRRYCLGLAVDSTVPREIANGIAECLHKSPEQLGDRQQMLAFAEQNSVERFAQVIFEHLAG